MAIISRNHITHLLCFFGIFVLSACSVYPPEAYYNRGAPESLLDVSSEIVSLDVSSNQSLDELSAWLNQDQPTRAEIYCVADDVSCTAAQDVLDLYGVPSDYFPSTDYSVALIYERVLVRDCENRFIDNPGNAYNLNHPTYGCSTAANIVQMVADKQQFVSPNLLDLTDGKKSVQTYNAYLRPTAVREDRDLSESSLDEIGSQ